MSEVSEVAVPAPRFRRFLLMALVAVAVAAVAVLGWLVSTREVAGAAGLPGGGAQSSLQADREAVMAQTGQFMLRMGTYGPDLLDEQGTMPQYRRRVEEVITPKFRVSFDKEAGTAEQLVAQAGISRTAEVFATGVSAIDADSATALVAGTFTDSYPAKAKGTGAAGRHTADPTPFRIEVRLVKVDGRWLVDDFTPVTGADR